MVCCARGGRVVAVIDKLLTRGRVLAFAALSVLPVPAVALDDLSIRLVGSDNDTLLERLNGASILVAAERDGNTAPQDLLAAALSDYTRLLETLYAFGYYSGVINIRIDGREAALIPLLETPAAIRRITVDIAPGKPFTFGAAEIAPLPEGVRMPREFRPGERARAEAVSGAVGAAVGAWREAGHAKAQPGRQDITANHATQVLNARIAMQPGPMVRFGALVVAGDSAVRETRIRRIAGLPEGEVFSPDALDKAATRLRRTGAFRSVTLNEGETLGPGNSMDITASVVDEKPRRFGLGAEISSFEGLRLTGFWMHRNLLGGAERFRVEGEVAGIGGQTGGVDYRLSARLDRPAVWGADTSLFVTASLEHLDEPDFRTDRAELGIGAKRLLSDTLTAELGVGLSRERTEDGFGRRDITLLTLPGALTWDRRDSVLNPRRGHYLRAEATPFAGIEGTGDGARLRLDARGYLPLVPDGDIVLAGRLQWGALYGAALAEAPSGFLFYSGGGGTVRGQPYQSLGVTQGTTRSGGRGFLGASVELRGKLTGAFSLVGFADAGFVSADPGLSAAGDWHAGAGLGLRYDTAVGPIRLDVAAPVRGGTGDGIQLYIGIGQAF